MNDYSAVIKKLEAIEKRLERVEALLAGSAHCAAPMSHTLEYHCAAGPATREQRVDMNGAAHGFPVSRL